MRAARAAARGDAENDCGGPTNGLGQLLGVSEQFLLDSKGSVVDYFLQVALPLMKQVVDELYGQEPEQRSVQLALWLLERCGAPRKLLSELEAWKGTAVEGALPAAEGNDNQVRPPSGEGRRDSAESPRKASMRKNLRNSEPAGSPNMGTPATADTRGGSPQNRQGDEPVSPVENRPKRGATFAQAEEEVVAIIDTHEEGDDSDDAEEEDAARLMRGTADARSRGSVAGQRMDVRRRFTVNMERMELRLPPEQEVLDLLGKVPALEDCDKDDLLQIASVAKCHRYEDDENVQTPGLFADRLHVVVDGVGKISVPYQIGTLTRGDFFGEEALQLAKTTSTTQVAGNGGPLTTISVASADFHRLTLKKQNVYSSHRKKDRILKGATTAASSITARRASELHEVDAEYRQTPSDRQLIQTALKNNKMLTGVLELTEAQYEMIADSVYLIRVKEGEAVMKKGERGTALYIVQDGILDVVLGDSAVHREIKLRPGDSFGELALVHDTPRSASVVAVKACSLWVLARGDFKQVTSLTYKARIAEYSELIAKIPSISSMVDPINRDMIADVLEKVTFYDGEDLCIQGQDAGLLFIIYEGQCEEIRDGVVTRTLQRGDWIGEAQIMTHTVSEVTIRACKECETVTALVLDSSSLHHVVKALAEMSKTRNSRRNTMKLDMDPAHVDHVTKGRFADDFLQRRLSHYQRKTRTSILPMAETHSRRFYDVQQTVQIGLLGEGSFGSVFLLEHKESKEHYALKTISKERIIQENLVQSIRNERNVMKLLHNDFIAGFYGSYEDPRNVFFLLEPLIGGDLFDLYYDKNIFGSIPHAKFYIACCILGLQHLHMNRVVYRDLKLENCLLSQSGYVKLTDMGIAKVVVGKTYTVCGTSDYFAPETLKQCGHDRAVDWWACGVLLFIISVGRSPFDAPDQMQIYKNIMKGFSKVQFPLEYPSDLADVIKSLCRKKPEDRVTMQKGGVASLQAMPFFSAFAWDKLADLTMEPVFVPPKVDLQRYAARKATQDLDFDLANLQEWQGSEIVIPS